MNERARILVAGIAATAAVALVIWLIPGPREPVPETPEPEPPATGITSLDVDLERLRATYIARRAEVERVEAERQAAEAELEALRRELDRIETEHERLRERLEGTDEIGAEEEGE